ncbi:D-psicose/D-tagatose/L-ribulose 3-epimerase [Asanoa hainanensis]|uniref:D-psicose/D-tagatose/L-ribulose 3-epimerase n=1 Tax=Asanoa hainanensis TaxID=560556 RepID=A0A239P272_9ACTN|nr:sugar phosphate isomerase/epimerase family protein [Asanoa hainanensis]SNT61221.1 D-psicose/D-tagatose/L-ribulose 3-epimerase [Asanoa hainanensis]
MFTIGANPWIWTSPVDDAALASLVPKIADWGFDAIEIPVENLGDWSPEKTRDLLGAYGLTAAAVLSVTPPGRDLVNTDPATVRATQDYLRSLVDAAVVLGAPSVCGPAYAAVGRVWRMTPAERTACYASLRDALAPVAEHAGACGVRIGLEALNRYETSVLNTVEQTLTAVEGLPSSVGIMLDSYHMNIEEADPYAAIRTAGPRLVHVQVSGSDRGAPGDDHIDWPRWLRTLALTGYRGPLCIESFTGENESIAVAASIWRPFAPSQDDLARNGLRYLREVCADL